MKIKSQKWLAGFGLVLVGALLGAGLLLWLRPSLSTSTPPAPLTFLIERAGVRAADAPGGAGPLLLAGLPRRAKADWGLLATHFHDVIFGKSTPGVPVLPAVWQNDGGAVALLATVKTAGVTRLYPLRGANAESALALLVGAIGTAPVEALKLDFVATVLTDQAGQTFANNKKNLGLYGAAFADGAQTVWLPEEILVNGFDAAKLTDPQPVYFTTQSYFVTRTAVLLLDRGHPLWPDDGPDSELTDGLAPAIAAATDYLAGKIDDDGRFTYIYDPLTDDAPDQYNLIRHAGTLYALSEAYAWQNDAALLQKIQAGLRFLLQRAGPCGAAAPDGLCVSEKDKLKLGANALTLLALTKYDAVTGDRQHLPVMRQLAAGIVAMQQPTGEFWSTVILPDWKKGDHVSEYYPGEAVLALTRLYQTDPNPLWLQTAGRAADFLILTRDKDKTAKNITHDHWMLIALNELHRAAPKPHHLTHVEKIVTAIQNAQIRNSKWPDENGGYYRPPRSTPTAVRSEGLIAAYHLLSDHGHGARARSLLPTIRKNLLFQLRTQVVAANALYFPNPPKALGGFQGGLTETDIRIDYVQHNLSSLIGFYGIVQKEKPSW